MGFIELGLIGGATYMALQSHKDAIGNVIDCVKQAVVDLVQDTRRHYAAALKDAAEDQSKKSGYQRNCTAKFVWKWADTRNYSLKEMQSYGKYFVLQSCADWGASTIPTAIGQGSNNGVAEDHPNWPDQNGGLNPILSQRSFQFFKNGQQGRFESSEQSAAIALLANNGLPPTYWSSVIATVKGVGFFRLSEYHWMATIDMALQLLAKDCRQATVKFQCTSETNKWYDAEWRRRLQVAAGDSFQKATDGVNPDIIKDYRGEPIIVEPIYCGVDSLGEEVWSVPLTCGEERTFWPETVESVKNGPCRNLFKRLSPQFHNPKNYLDSRPEENRHALFGPFSLPRKAD